MGQFLGNLPSTLGNWLMLTKIAFGDWSPAANFLRHKIAESPGGFDEPVLADETQMLMMLAKINRGEIEEGPANHEP
jgi:hypothetical protein